MSAFDVASIEEEAPEKIRKSLAECWKVSDETSALIQQYLDGGAGCWGALLPIISSKLPGMDEKHLGEILGRALEEKHGQGLDILWCELAGRKFPTQSGMQIVLLASSQRKVLLYNYFSEKFKERGLASAEYFSRSIATTLVSRGVKNLYGAGRNEWNRNQSILKVVFEDVDPNSLYFKSGNVEGGVMMHLGYVIGQLLDMEYHARNTLVGQNNLNEVVRFLGMAGLRMDTPDGLAYAHNLVEGMDQNPDFFRKALEQWLELGGCWKTLYGQTPQQSRIHLDNLPWGRREKLLEGVRSVRDRGEPDEDQDQDRMTQI